MASESQAVQCCSDSERKDMESLAGLIIANLHRQLKAGIVGTGRKANTELLGLYPPLGREFELRRPTRGGAPFAASADANTPPRTETSTSWSESARNNSAESSEALPDLALRSAMTRRLNRSLAWSESCPCTRSTRACSAAHAETDSGANRTAASSSSSARALSPARSSAKAHARCAAAGPRPALVAASTARAKQVRAVSKLPARASSCPQASHSASARRAPAPPPARAPAAASPHAQTPSWKAVRAAEKLPADASRTPQACHHSSQPQGAGTAERVRLKTTMFEDMPSYLNTYLIHWHNYCCNIFLHTL
jgi:hypothetical protein